MDYTKSAVNLRNPIEVGNLLVQYRKEEQDIESIQSQIQALIPKELQEKLEELQNYHAETNNAIRKAIDEFGSYQDLETGVYGVKQRKVSKSYNAENFKLCYSQFAPAIIIETIDIPKLSGLIKGNLITEDDLRRKNILKETETFSYIIK